MIHLRNKLSRRVGWWVVRLIETKANSAQLELNLVWALQLLPFNTSVKLHITEIHISCKINFIGWMLDVGCWMDVGWMVGESGIKANSAQFSWSLAELGKNITRAPLTLPVYESFWCWEVNNFTINLFNCSSGLWSVGMPGPPKDGAVVPTLAYEVEPSTIIALLSKCS